MAVSTEGPLLAGRYRVLRQIGTGGMGRVFLCEDERLGRKVAVKRLHADSPEDVARRFAREARLGASLNHQNVVSVFDTVTDDEGVLIVMEHVDGPDLRAELKRGRLDPERALAIVRDVAAALDHAHEHGVVHRDVKPANILVRRDGAVKLVDLGIATATDTTQITKSGVVLGTASYMAPEQLEGETAGPPADVYALACVAFEAFGGRKAREGRTPMEIAHQVASEEPPDLREAWPEAPAALAAALRRGLAREPYARPATAGELAGEIEEALDDEPTLPQPVAPQPPPTAATDRLDEEPPAPRIPYRPHRARRSSRAVPVALALVMLALAAVLAGVLLSGGDGDSDRAERSQPGGGQSAEQPAGDGEQPSGGGGEPEAGNGGAPPGGESGSPPEPSGNDPAEGARLQREGYRLMQAGRYDEAIPVLERSVASFPAGTDDIQYAYALYNLGRSLRLAGRPQEAVPVLEKRLQIPNQTSTVRRELEAARKAAAEQG